MIGSRDADLDRFFHPESIVETQGMGIAEMCVKRKGKKGPWEEKEEEKNPDPECSLRRVFEQRVGELYHNPVMLRKLVQVIKRLKMKKWNKVQEFQENGSKNTGREIYGKLLRLMGSRKEWVKIQRTQISGSG